MLESNADDAPIAPVTVRIECEPRGGWQVEMPNRSEPLPCETLEDAGRVAYRTAVARPCQLIVRDAYHRVLRHEVIPGSARSRRGRR